MSRVNVFRLSVLNIVLHPHSPVLYTDLLKEAFKLKRVIPVRGKRCAILRHVWEVDRKVENSALRGSIIFFTQIDASGTWVDIENLQFLEEDEQKERIRLPQNLMPDSYEVNFIFFPSNHHMVFEVYYRGKATNPRYIKAFFQDLFQTELLVKKFGDVVLTLIPERDSLNKILKMRDLRKLEIHITRPNPDDLAGLQANVLGEMQAMKVERISRLYQGDGSGAIQPNDHVANLARVAEANGSVVGFGHNANGSPVRESTLDHPLVHPSTHDPNGEVSYLDKLRQVAIDLVKELHVKKK